MESYESEQKGAPKRANKRGDKGHPFLVPGNVSVTWELICMRARGKVQRRRIVVAPETNKAIRTVKSFAGVQSHNTGRRAVMWVSQIVK